ncbi:hypothetical protein BV898_11512 [Hypsibius exemplaris]|uniref:Protein quiver n=1 Tax=Hypsibius exemplaris TaxID=2072580 RepID=A0A1W0WGF4_HYPEX|nr:hypothetical protein BV898_11512 [Hypsibius exemplaris]
MGLKVELLQILHACFSNNILKMDRYLRGSSVFVLLACVIVSTWGFKCFDCNKKDCDAPPVSFAKDCPTNVAHCYKTYAKSGSIVTTVRGCGKASGSQAASIGDNACQVITLEAVSTTVCNCNSDSCNAAAVGTKTSLVAAGLGVALALLLTN